jgi:hypothetical protein
MEVLVSLILYQVVHAREDLVYVTEIHAICDDANGGGKVVRWRGRKQVRQALLQHNLISGLEQATFMHFLSRSTPFIIVQLWFRGFVRGRMANLPGILLGIAILRDELVVLQVQLLHWPSSQRLQLLHAHECIRT